MVKKFGMLIILVMVVAGVVFAQELQITRVENNGSDVGIDGHWPIYSRLADQWNALFKRYNLVSLNSDPFAQSDGLEARIRNLARRQFGDELDLRPAAYTVYLTMGSRRFICFILNSYGDWYAWVYESK
jgi:hypothetical protein